MSGHDTQPSRHPDNKTVGQENSSHHWFGHFRPVVVELCQRLVVQFTWLISISTARTALITASVFVFDWLTPLGVSGGVLYMAAVLSAVPIRHRWAIWITAGICSLLVLLGAISAGRGETEIWKVLLNRTLALGVIWACAALAESWNRLQRRRTRQLQESRLLQQATALSASEVSFQEALQNSVTALCDILGWPVGHVYVREAGGQQLVSADAWHFPDDGRFELLRTAATGVRFARGEGVPGRIWETGQPIAVPDVSQSVDYKWLKDPERLGVQGAYAFPLTVGQRVAAVVEFFSEHEIAVDPEFSALACNIGQQMGRLFERRRAEQALRESEERLRLALADGHMGTWEWQMDSGRVIWSPELERLHGLAPGAFDGTFEAYQQSIHPDDRQRISDEIRLAVETEQEFHAEYRMLHPDNDVRWFEARGAVHVGDGRERRMAGICMDITERKQVEAETRRAKEAAEAVNRLRSRFLANVSHELRTPMNAILGMLQLALQTEQLSPQLADYLQTAKDSADSLLVLLNDLLDFSRLEADRLRIHSEPLQLRETLDQTIKPLSANAFEKHLELICHVDADVPDGLIGDADRLRQVITNLISNATKFTNRGEVVVRVQLEQKLPREARLCFSVSDTGMGISPADQQRIFEPFTQSEDAAARRYGGVGLGLAICRELTRRMGGRMGVESELGAGSRFWFSLNFPVVQSEMDGEKTEAVQLELLQGLSVLVVDDNDTNRLMLVDILQRWAMRPEAAIDGDHALGKLHRASSEEQSFALIVADRWMPGMDGYELARRTAADFEQAPPLILMLAAADRQSLQEQGTILPVAAYLEKPVSPSKLLDAVMTALDVQPPLRLDDGSAWSVVPPARILSVLLVEDTPANQKVVAGILGRRGHRVTVAEDGRQGTELFQRRQFDVVLMDIQMPVMDGYQATEEMRQMEQDRAAKTPIIAMTAHAMEGDRQRCLAAGMDSYLTKPIDVKQLIEVVETISANRASTGFRSASEVAPDEPIDGHPQIVEGDRAELAVDEDVDFAAALRRLANDEALMLEFIQAFGEDAPELLESIRQAIVQRDADLLERAAHSLKGLAANVGGTAVAHCAAELERRGASREFDGADNVRSALELAITRLQRAFSTFRQQTGSA